MANRNAKLIERVLKDFSLGVMNGSGGAKIVTELPKVGEEHTIYELHQNVEPAYNWVAEINYRDFDSEYGLLLVVETYEDMLAKVNEDTHFPEDVECLVYLRAEDRMFVNFVDGESGDMVYIEVPKKSAYTFEINGKYLYVLKSIRVDLGTPEHPLEDPMYWGTLYNGTEFLLDPFSGNDVAFILHQATFDVMGGFIANGNIVHQVSTLPTAQETVTNYLDELIANEGSISVEVDNQVKYNLDSSKTYHWREKPAIPDPIYNFWEYVEDGVEPVYTGELEWENLDFPIYTEIPYQDIFNRSLSKWIFKPEQGGEKVSYWVYTNNVWVNLDNVGEIVMPVTSVGDFGFNNTGLDLKYFDFYINGIKAECVQYGTLVIGEGGEASEEVYPIGYLKGIALPTTESNHYSVEVRFTGTAEQLSGNRALSISVFDRLFESQMIDQITFKNPMTLEFDGLHELVINGMTSTM